MLAKNSKRRSLALIAGAAVLGFIPTLCPAQEPLPRVRAEVFRLPVTEPRNQNQPVPLPATEYRLEDFEGMAQQYNPTLVQASWAVENARGVMRQSGLYPNPSVGYLRSDPSNPLDSRKQGALLSQTIVTGNKLQLNRNAESHEVNALSWDFEAQKMRVANDVRLRFYELLAAQQSLKLSKQLLEIAEEGVRLADLALKAKTGNRTDLLQARIQLNEVRGALRDAENRYRASWQQLSAIIGLPDLEPAHVVGTLKVDVPTLDFDTSWQRLVSSSPQIFTAQARVDRAKALYQRARAEPIPDVTVQVIGERDSTLKSSSLSTLIAIPLPIYNRNQGNIQSTHAEIHEAESEVERVQLALRDQLAITFRRYETARSQVVQYEKEVLPDAKENLDLSLQGFRAGEFALLNVLFARQTYSQTNLAYIDALVEQRRTEIEINGLLLTGGGLNPAAIGTAIQQTNAAGRLRVQGLLNQSQQDRSGQFLPAAGQVGGN